MSSTELKTTPLHSLHVERGARMVSFAGWEMPIQYEGVVAEHTWCRTSAALFDVAHMAVVELWGDEVAVALETTHASRLHQPRRRPTALRTPDQRRRWHHRRLHGVSTGATTSRWWSTPVVPMSICLI